MDLGAYQQIENLDQIAKKNEIEIPRVRGYRLMKDEEPIPTEEIEKWKKKCEVSVVEDMCTAIPFWSTHPICYESSEYTDYLKNIFLIKNSNDEGYERYIDIRWDRIHGWKRKALKFEIKKQKRRIQNNMIYGINMLVKRVFYIFIQEWVEITGSILMTKQN